MFYSILKLLLKINYRFRHNLSICDSYSSKEKRNLHQVKNHKANNLIKILKHSYSIFSIEKKKNALQVLLNDESNSQWYVKQLIRTSFSQISKLITIKSSK